MYTATPPAVPPPQTSRTQNYQMGPAEWATIGGLSIIWGGSFLFVRLAVLSFTPFTIVFIRLFIATLLLLPFAIIRTIRDPEVRTFLKRPKTWRQFLVMGLINNALPFSLITWSLQYVPGSTGSVLNATTPIFSVIFVQLLTNNDRLTPSRIFGVALGWVGVIVLIGFEAIQGFGSDVIGLFAMLLASCCYALAAIYGRRFNGQPPRVVATGMLLSANIILVPVILLDGRAWKLVESVPLISWAAVIALGALSTGIGYLIYYRILARAGATNVLLVTFLIPVSAITLNVIVMGDVIGWNVIVGSVLLAIGLLSIDGRLGGTCS